MIRISLSKLESARANPSIFAHSLIDIIKSSGGNPGFVGCWKTIARNHHETDSDNSRSIDKLNDKLFASFKENKANNDRRSSYIESFKSYLETFSDLELIIDKFQINIKWPLIPKTLLTGRSPFLCSDNNYKIAYFFQERFNDWQDELKYPLLQIYLAESFYKCDVSNIKIGVYSIYDKQFDLRTFEDFELDNALEEAKFVFKNVSDIYNKFST